MTTAELPISMEGVKQRPEWQTALIHERYDLSARLNDLLRTLSLGSHTPPLNDVTRNLIAKQVKAMKRYLWCLDQRIARFRTP